MKEIIKVLKNSKRVAIIAHISPDADCLGSMTALSCILNKLNIENKMFVDYDFKGTIHKFYNLNESSSEDINPNEFDLIATVDVATPRLMGKYYPIFSNFENTLSIDHHGNRDLKAKTLYVNANSSSCAEIIYELCVELGVEIDANIATLIYSGIIGDTNCFQNDNVNERTFKIASDCIKYGADFKTVNFEIYKKRTKEQVKLKTLGYKNMRTENGVAYVIFTKKMFKEAGTEDDCKFANEILNIDDNKFAIVIKQKDKNSYTVTLRCKQKYNVANIAKKYGGGGHNQASGLAFTGSATNYIKLLIEDCLNQIKEVENV